MSLIASIMVLFSILVPTKAWYAPSAPIQIKVEAAEPVRLVAIDFTGKRLEPAAGAAIDAQPGQMVDLKATYPKLQEPGTYVLFAVPAGKQITEFAGTPLLVQARQSPKFGGPTTTTVIHVEPLVYANMTTRHGEMKIIFWYDVAPNTVNAFINLSRGGFYDELSFHRIVPDFVIQGGDPTGTGFGGPGYTLPAEFNDRAHDVGVLSMARTGDPFEQKGMPPRPEYAGSAGSQFFICLTRERCQTLDRKYTAFGQVVSGIETVKAIGGVAVQGDKPTEPQRMDGVKVVPVTAADNPYQGYLKLDLLRDVATAATAPASK